MLLLFNLFGRVTYFMHSLWCSYMISIQTYSEHRTVGQHKLLKSVISIINTFHPAYERVKEMELVKIPVNQEFNYVAPNNLSRTLLPHFLKNLISRKGLVYDYKLLTKLPNRENLTFSTISKKVRIIKILAISSITSTK